MSSSRGGVSLRGEGHAHRSKAASPSRQERSPERQKHAGQRGSERQHDRHSHSPERQAADRSSHQGSKRGAQLTSPRGRSVRGRRGSAAASPRVSKSARRRRNRHSPRLASPAERAPKQPCLSGTPARNGPLSGQASHPHVLPCSSFIPGTALLACACLIAEAQNSMLFLCKPNAQHIHAGPSAWHLRQPIPLHVYTSMHDDNHDRKACQLMMSKVHAKHVLSMYVMKMSQCDSSQMLLFCNCPDLTL